MAEQSDRGLDLPLIAEAPAIKRLAATLASPELRALAEAEALRLRDRNKPLIRELRANNRRLEAATKFLA
ncbi:hypothetical protein [Methylocaldum sp.]|uniref:hypothetical protein n=1 Tax=Methylocaldum sp. TaxID=1969727 RepID=UPI002D4D32AC|nr:hypothetical protein [Methylocaldum sp.]HYE38247.1 hypothetical protein [Methylocaldum sp.]